MPEEMRSRSSATVTGASLPVPVPPKLAVRMSRVPPAISTPTVRPLPRPRSTTAPSNQSFIRALGKVAASNPPSFVSTTLPSTASPAAERLSLSMVAGCPNAPDTRKSPFCPCPFFQPISGIDRTKPDRSEFRSKVVALPLARCRSILPHPVPVTEPSGRPMAKAFSARGDSSTLPVTRLLPFASGPKSCRQVTSTGTPSKVPGPPMVRPVGSAVTFSAPAVIRLPGTILSERTSLNVPSTE